MRGRNTVYICSPFAGDTIRNKQYARELTKAAVELNCVPITPHLYITECLNDDIDEERSAGLEIAQELLLRCDFILIGEKYGVSVGMQNEIAIAQEYGIPILGKGVYNSKEF